MWGACEGLGGGCGQGPRPSPGERRAAAGSGPPPTRAGALAPNAVHDGEHYGNIITYMRMKGMVPPSSRR